MAAIIRILLVEDNPMDARLVRIALGDTAEFSYDVLHVSTMAAAEDSLALQRFDAILLDLNLPESIGLQTFLRLSNRVLETPIIVLSAEEDLTVALEALKLGAQDYLVKGEYNGAMLRRSIQYSVERFRLLNQVRDLSLHDELTRLYNRRGFLTVAEHYLRIAVRERECFVVIFLDLDHLKYVNDHFGHQAGDKAISSLADVMRETFRDSDIMGRLGGDEFIVVLPGVDEVTIAPLLKRYHDVIEARNTRDFPDFRLSATYGVRAFTPTPSLTIGEVLRATDDELYAQKRARPRFNPAT